MRIEKRIGKYSEKQARSYFKQGIPFLATFAILFITSLDYLPFYIDLGVLEPPRHFVNGVVFTYGLFMFFLPFYTWKSGLNGERRVVNNVSRNLSNEYSLFNDVLIRDGCKGNIDHIIVGPKGILVIETKNNQGAISYDGFKWTGIKGSPSQQVNKNMFRVKDILKNCEVFKNKELYLRSIVVFSNPKAKITISKDPEWNCRIIHLKNIQDTTLADFINEGYSNFSDQDIESIEKCLKPQINNFEE
jgi:hypothetical protein